MCLEANLVETSLKMRKELTKTPQMLQNKHS